MNAIPVTYKTYHVADEANDPNSILNWYKALLALRHTDPALLEGAYIPLNESDPNVFSCLRKSGDYAVLVAINMSGAPQIVRFDLTKQGLAANSAKTLLTTQSSLKDKTSLEQISLEPFAVYVGAVQE